MSESQVWVESCDYTDMPGDRAIVQYSPLYGCGGTEGGGWGDGDAYGNGAGNSSRAYYVSDYVALRWPGDS
jgi:hypothetical protein